MLRDQFENPFDTNPPDEQDWSRLAAQEAWSFPAPNKTETPAQSLPADQPTAAQTSKETSLRLLERAVELADRTNVDQARNRVIEGQRTSLDVNELAAQPGLSNEQREVLARMQLRVRQEQWQEYQHYLDPALARAQLAFAKIASGNNDQIAEGEKLLLKAVELRPELQLNEDFQERLLLSYKDMESKRQAQGLPAWHGELKVEPQAPKKISNGSESLEQANAAYSKDGIKAALPHFEAAIKAADEINQEETNRNLLALFCKRLTVERTIIANDARGISSHDLTAELRKAQESEWSVYRDHLSPGSIRVNTALALISSGEPELLSRGKALLTEAISKRPELEFDARYQEHVLQAFTNHHKNKPDPSVAVKPENFDIGYKPIAIDNLGKGSTAIENDKQVVSYTADTLTGPVLTAATIYLGFRVFKGRIERIRAARDARAESTAAGKTDSSSAETPGEKTLNTKSDITAETQSQRAAKPESTSLEIRTSPFESGNQQSPRIERPALAMDSAKMIEVNLPGGIVARMTKLAAPGFLERVEKEFKSADFGKVLDELINDKTLSEKERRELTELKTRFENLPVETREESKAEFFRNIRSQLGLQNEMTEPERARSMRVGRALAIGGGIIGVGILSSAILRHCLKQEAHKAATDRIQVQFIQKP